VVGPKKIIPVVTVG